MSKVTIENDTNGKTVAPQGGDLMDSQEVMAELHISRSTLQRLVTGGYLAPAGERNPVLGRPARLYFERAAVAALKAHPPARKPGPRRKA